MKKRFMRSDSRNSIVVVIITSSFFEKKKYKPKPYPYLLTLSSHRVGFVLTVHYNDSGLKGSV